MPSITNPEDDYQGYTPPAWAPSPLAPIVKPLKVGTPINGATPPPGLPPLMSSSSTMPDGFADFVKQLSGSRDADLKGGMDFFGKYFGNDNPEMKAIMDARKAAAFGPDTQTALARQAGTEGINRSLQTAMRQFQGSMPGTGVRGGAAGAMGGILARGAIDNTRGLERDLALSGMDRRRAALGDYEHSLTGERAGLLGSAFGTAGLGAQDRNSALGFLTSKNWLDQAKAQVDANGNPVAGDGGGMSWQDKIKYAPQGAWQQLQKVGQFGKGGMFAQPRGLFGGGDGDSDANKYNPFQGGNNFAASTGGGGSKKNWWE